MPYASGICTHCACIAKVALLSIFAIFQFFLIIYTTYGKAKNTLVYRKKKTIFFIIYMTCRKKKLHAFTAKKVTRLDIFCPGAVRPAVCCPAVGEGLRCRQRRSAVKLTPLIIPPDSCCRTVGNGRSFGRTEGTFVDGRSGPTMLFWHFFFYWPESEDPFKKSRKTRFHEI